MDDFYTKLGDKTYIQMGGNETIGQGWFSVRVINGGNEAAEAEQGAAA